jgi:hypothetical protein
MVKNPFLLWRPIPVVSMHPLLPVLAAAWPKARAQGATEPYNTAKRERKIVDEESGQPDVLKSRLIKAPADPSP